MVTSDTESKPGRSHPPLWLVEGLDVVELRRSTVVAVALGVAVVGILLAMFAPGIVPPVPLVGAAVGIAAVLLGLAVAIALDAAELRLRGPRHVAAAGGELVAVLPTLAERDGAATLAGAVLEAREPGSPLLLGLAASGRDVRHATAWTDALAVALEEEGVSVLRIDLASGPSEPPGLLEVIRDDVPLSEAVRFVANSRLARLGAGEDHHAALDALGTLPSRLPRDLDVLLVALPMAATREVVGAVRSLDHVLIVAQRDRTSRVELIAGLDALEAAGTRAQVALLDDRTAARLARPAEPAVDEDHAPDGVDVDGPPVRVTEAAPADAAEAAEAAPDADEIADADEAAPDADEIDDVDEAAPDATGADVTDAAEASEGVASEADASETGASETGASETGASETGASETGASETTGELGSPRDAEDTDDETRSAPSDRAHVVGEPQGTGGRPGPAATDAPGVGGAALAGAGVAAAVGTAATQPDEPAAEALPPHEPPAEEPPAGEAFPAREGTDPPSAGASDVGGSTRRDVDVLHGAAEAAAISIVDGSGAQVPGLEAAPGEADADDPPLAPEGAQPPEEPPGAVPVGGAAEQEPAVPQDRPPAPVELSSPEMESGDAIGGSGPVPEGEREESPPVGAATDVGDEEVARATAEDGDRTDEIPAISDAPPISRQDSDHDEMLRTTAQLSVLLDDLDVPPGERPDDAP